MVKYVPTGYCISKISLNSKRHNGELVAGISTAVRNDPRMAVNLHLSYIP